MARLLGFLAMSFVWGITWIGAKWAFLGAPPVFTASLRLFCSSGCFLIWSLAAGHSLRTSQPVRLVLASMILNAGCYGLLFWGVDHAPSGLAAIINLSLVPVFSMLIGAAVGEETITLRRVVALLIGAGGLALLFSGRPTVSGEVRTEILFGLAAVVGGTFGYAWGAIASKPLVREMSPIPLAFWSTLIGAATLLPIALALEGFRPDYLTGFLAWRPAAGLAILVFGGSLVGFSVYLWLLREWGAFRAGLYAFVSPIIAVGIGVLVLGEPFGVAEGLGMLVMLTATALVLKPERV